MPKTANHIFDFHFRFQSSPMPPIKATSNFSRCGVVDGQRIQAGISSSFTEEISDANKSCGIISPGLRDVDHYKAFRHLVFPIVCKTIPQLYTP